MKNAVSMVIVAWVLGIMGCAAPYDSASSPKGVSNLACSDVQKRVPKLDGQDPNRLLREVVEMSFQMPPDESGSLEECLEKNFRLECDPNSCRIREKYFVKNKTGFKGDL